MSLSIRLDPEMENKIRILSKRLRIPKSEVIRKSLKRFLSEVSRTESSFPYQIYKMLEDRIPASGLTSLSMNHRTEVLKRIQQRRRS